MTQPVPRQRRLLSRLCRLVVRLAAGVALIAALAYTTLPWWFPTGRLAARLVGDLSAQLGRPVSVAAVHLGWTRGVEITDLVIAGGPAGSRHPLARMHRVAFDLQPVRLLLGSSPQLRVDGVEVWLEVDSDGGIRNLPPLAADAREGITFDRYSIRDILCHLHPPGEPQTVRLDRLDCRLDADNGVLSLHAAATTPQRAHHPAPAAAGVFLIDADMTWTRLRSDRRLGGVVRIDWKDLAFSELPLALVPRLPLQQVEGLTSGELTIRPHADLAMDFRMRLDLNRVRFPRGPESPPGRPLDAHLESAGFWDPDADQILLSDLIYQTDAIELRPSGRGAALGVDRHGPTPLQVSLSGRIRSWAALQREWPELATFLCSAGVELTGAADFAVEIRQRARADQFVLDVDARESDFRMRGSADPDVVASAGVHKTLRLEAHRDRREPSRGRALIRCNLADLSLSLQGELPLDRTSADQPFGWSAPVLHEFSGRLSANAQDLRQVHQHFPGLARLAGLDAAAGPAQVTVVFEPQSSHSELRVDLKTSDETTLAAGDWLRVEPGRPVEVMTQIDIPHAGGAADLHLRASLGGLQVEVPGASLTYQFRSHEPAGQNDPRPADELEIDLALDLPMRLAHIESLSKLIPRWADLTGPVAASGQLELRCRLDLARRPDELAVSSQLDLLGDGLELRYRDQRRKPAGQPLRLDLEHRLAVTREGREQSGRLELDLRPLRVAADIAFAGLESQDLSDDFEQIRLVIDVKDAAETLALAPELAGPLQRLQVRGRSRLELCDLLIGSRQSLTLHMDATQADLLLGGDDPVHKPAGMPASCELAWSARADPAAPALQTWELDNGRLELGGWQTTRLSGHVTLESPGGAAFVTRGRRGWRAAGRKSFRSANVRAEGLLRFDESLATLGERARRILDDYQLTGVCAHELELEATPDQISLSGVLRGENAGFSVVPDQPHAPTIRKTVGTPAEAAFHVAATREDERTYRVQVRGADVTLSGLAASVDGLFLVASPPQGLALQGLDLTARLHLLDAGALGSLLADGAVRPRGGTCLASAHLSMSERGLTLDSAHLDLSELRLSTPGDPVAVDGVVTVEDGRLTADQLQVGWGPLSGALSGDVRLTPQAARGRMAVRVERLDLPDLGQRLELMPTPAGAPSIDPAASLRPVFEYLRGSDLTLSSDAGVLIFNLPLEVPVTVDALSMHTDIRQGKGDLAFRCLVDGGFVSGRCAVDLVDPRAPFHLTYTAERIQPGKLVDRYLSLTFPGMKATGPLTLIDETHQKFLPRPGELNHPVGKGEMMIDGGTIEGRSAPEWMARIFPGLNLSTFAFSYMHSWFDKTIDGRIRHQMIYQGRYYNIYAVGTGDIEGRIDYEVGLDFFADFDSQYWAESGQGRIPLFRKTGVKAPDGSLQNEVVTYTPPQRILDTLLVKNNPLVTAYHAVRKRVLREQ